MSETPRAPQARSNGLITLVAGGLRELYVRPEGQLSGLDALRSAAILLVIGTHWALPEYEVAHGVPTSVQQFPLFSYGWTGVDLFFVLSGYLIGRQLWRELKRTGTVQLGVFLLRRGLRIWPLYFAMLIYYTLTSPDVHPRISDWTFLSNYLPAGMARTWSLSTEEQFYIAVPLLILLLKRRIPLATYAWVLLGIEVMVLAVRKVTLTSYFAAGGLYEKADHILIYPFHTHLEGLLAGLFIALLVETRPKILEVRSRSGISWLGLGILGASVLTVAGLRTLDQRLFAFFNLGLIFGALTFWVLTDRSWLSRPLGAWIFYPISRLSYGMYLNHWWFARSSNVAIVSFVQRFTDRPSVVFLVTLAIGTIASIAFAVLTFVLIEHPFLLLRERWLAHRRASKVPSNASVRMAGSTEAA